MTNTLVDTEYIADGSFRQRLGAAPGTRLYAAAVAAVAVFAVLQVAAVPLAVSYDGHIYIDMADVLFSSRFPHDWSPIRTPLYAALLKGGFEVCGKHPVTVLLVNALLGLAGVLALGACVRRVAGPRSGALAMVLTAPCPLLVTYQHFALTEVGVFTFLAALVAMLTWMPATKRGRWVKALGLALVVTAAFYHRQNTITLAPVVALLYLLSTWKTGDRGSPDNGGLAGRRKFWTGRGAVLVQTVLVGVLPFVLAKPWDRYTDNAGIRDYMLKGGILRQALLPPNHPCVGDQARAYARAIEESQTCGNFFSGMTSKGVGELAGKMFPALGTTPVRTFATLVWENPMRYLSGVGRTLLFFAGFRGEESENAGSMSLTLNPEVVAIRNMIGDGPPELDRQIKSDFGQRFRPGLLLHGLWKLRRPYQILVIGAMFLLVLELVVGLALRHWALVSMAAVPLAYLGFYALILASNDRYAFPAYPLALASAVAFPVLLWRAVRPSSRSVAA